MSQSAAKSLTGKLEAQPLYARVRAELVNRLISGAWKPAELLPSEFAIAAELGVSQGTVRKALDEMTTQGLVVRRQGRGTFVAEAEDQNILFRFYRLTQDGAAKENASFPNSTYISQVRSTASEDEKIGLNLKAGEDVWRFERIRSQNNSPILWERLVLPVSIFSDLSGTDHLPNNVYQFYSANYGITVAKVEEQLRAVSATQEVASHLGLQTGAPLLQIDRSAIALDGRTIEWRRSLCRSDNFHYRNELS